MLTGDILAPAELPNLERTRRIWQIPLFLVSGALITSGLGLRTLYLSSDGAITFWLAGVWSIFLFTFILTELATYNRRVAWLHVQIDEKKGRRIAISLPLPLC